MPRPHPHGDAVLPLSMRSVQAAMNDDKEEKAARLHSRQAQHMRQMGQLRAAATSPHRKRKSLDDDEPPTPSQADEPFDVRGEGITPTKRVPLLANFEEWMKLATDNKINANNSWNFALIDYFHDMSLLKEGDGVNFQKASCTLDGCVKIYTSRVDSVATETGKLLSGLADSRQKKRQGDEEGDDEDGAAEGAEGEDGGKKKKSRTKRSAETTLVSSFEQLRLKKMELEFSVDPLFKKASADFDEGGAKGLLLNHLSIDNSGRIVFDSSDDVEEEGDSEVSRRDSMEPDTPTDEVDKTVTELQEATMTNIDIAIALLGARFFADLDELDSRDVCPSLKTLALGSSDPSLDLPFLKAPENWRDEPEATGTLDHHAANDAGLTDAEDGGIGNWDTIDVGFGEGGEAWARDAALQPQMRVQEQSSNDVGEDDEIGTFDANSSTYAITLQHNRPQDEHENILNYFDTANQKNWAGPEHWKVTRIKDTQRAGVAEKRTRKEKEAFEIDFSAPMNADMAALLYTGASSSSAINLPKKEWKSRTRNLLPDDKHFNSKDLLRLFLKPKAMLGARKANRSINEQKLVAATGEVDEAYWAGAHYGGMTEEHIPEGGYDANFFADDNLPMGGADLDDDDEIFADAHEMLSPDAEAPQGALGPDGPGIDGIADGTNGQGAFGAHLVTQSRRLRPEYVQYARVAKKVDVRRLKEEIWRGSGLNDGKAYQVLHADILPDS